MLTFFTDPYINELLYSTYARYHHYVGNIDLLDTLEELFGKRTVIPNLYLGSNLDYLCGQVEGKYNVEELIENHTIFPYYNPFLPMERKISLLNNMKYGNCEGIYTSLGFAAGGICRKKGIQYCCKCVESDIIKYGEPYIHREHQLEGILVCPHHKTILSTYKNNSMNTSRIQYIRLDEKELDFKKDINIINDNIIDFEKLIKISQMAYKLLHCSINNIDRNDVLNTYKNLLYEKGFMSIGNIVHQNELYYEFTRFYGEEFLKLLECNIDFNNDYNWLKVISRKSNRTSHPLRHLLLINFLVGDIDVFLNKVNKKYNPFGQGPWPCLNKAAEHYRQDVISDVIITRDSKAPLPVGTFKCSCGYIYSRKGPDKTSEDRYKIGKTKEFGYVWTDKFIEFLKEGTYSSRQLANIMGCDPNTIRKKASELNMNYFGSNKIENIQINSDEHEQKNGFKLEKFKDKVIEVVESNKGTGKLKIKALVPNEIRYICKYDKNWMDRVFVLPKCIENNKCVKIDWDERDRVYLSLVEEKCKEIYNRIPYQRVTKSAIGTELGIRNMLYNHAEKLPNTIQFVHSKQESVEQFRIRRCNNIIKTFIDDEIPMQLWKIQKLAGINKIAFNEIKDKLVYKL
ncbi:TnsD family transposase [Clostridium sp.]|jgi:predicted transcriptional regulator with HTH domain|uniref:TnsD family transposase n=1 Tax=Clostridium sp. TaxID=1506 RepID=UPI002587F349|nr:TnsD family transposase [Clostridium sp.]MDF2503027.1 transposase [Clostridium sp.]